MSDTAHDPAAPQDPLPEPSWKFRRVYNFGLTACLLWFIHICIEKVEDPTGIAYGMLTLIGITSIMYQMAPSAEHLVKLFNLTDLAKLRTGK